MNTRTFIKTGLTALAAAIAAPFIASRIKPVTTDEVKRAFSNPMGTRSNPDKRCFYRLDRNGCNPHRQPIYFLGKGDLFVFADPVTKECSRIHIVTEKPRLVEAPKGFPEPLTWCISCKPYNA